MILPEITVYKAPLRSFDFNKFRSTNLINSYETIQVDSINLILLQCAKEDINLNTQIAYILATAYHESKFKPIKESGSNKYLDRYDTGQLAKSLGNTPEDDDDGILYAGRGFVQITGKRNYSLFSRILGIDLLKDPIKVLEPEIAAFILVWGMKQGSFTGRKLSNYINQTKTDFISARKIINGTDKDELIANYANILLTCIN